MFSGEPISPVERSPTGDQFYTDGVVGRASAAAADADVGDSFFLFFIIYFLELYKIIK